MPAIDPTKLAKSFPKGWTDQEAAIALLSRLNGGDRAIGQAALHALEQAGLVEHDPTDRQKVRRIDAKGVPASAKETAVERMVRESAQKFVPFGNPMRIAKEIPVGGGWLGGAKGITYEPTVVDP